MAWQFYGRGHNIPISTSKSSVVVPVDNTGIKVDDTTVTVDSTEVTVDDTELTE